MSLDIDLNELGIELDDEKASALKEALSAKHQEALDKEVGGLKSKRDELLDAQRKMKDQLKQFEGIDPERARKLEQQLAENEEARLIADGKIDEVLSKRTERMQAEYERKLSEAQTEAEKAKARAEKFTGRAFSDELRTAAAQVGILDSAVPDAVYRGRELFAVDDDGNVVAKDGVLDQDGKPLTPETWLNSMRDQAPHWFPTPKGSGAPGSSGNGSSAPRAWQDAKTTRDKVEYLKRKQSQ